MPIACQSYYTVRERLRALLTWSVQTATDQFEPDGFWPVRGGKLPTAAHRCQTAACSPEPPASHSGCAVLLMNEAIEPSNVVRNRSPASYCPALPAAGYA